ncbi:MAG TPA: amino acid permease [Calditrichaeota bacterium]|nr:amino acid permease [Calditrichota bacterium]
MKETKRLNKELTLFNLYSIAIGATIASGFFLLPGLAFAQAGPAMVLSYLIAAIPVIPAILSKTELATAMPRAGGVYFYLDRSMGPLMGTIGGVGTWLALILKTAFALVGIGAYLSIFFPDASFQALAVGFSILFGVINLFGAKKSSFLQSFLVTGLLLLFIWFGGSGLQFVDLSRFKGFFDKGINSVFTTAGLVYVSYVGLSKIASISEEAKNPDKNIPLAMFLALGTAILVYALGTIVIVGIVPAETLANNLTPVTAAAEIIAGRWGAILMTLAAVFAFFSVTNAGILSCSRYPLAMSRDHLMPEFLRRLTARKTPRNSIVLSVLLVILVLLIFDASKIAKLAGAFQLMLFSLNSLAVIVMRESRIESYDPGFKSPFYPWMQIFGIIAPLWLIVMMGWMPSLVTVALIGISVLWYFYYGKNRVAREGAIYHIFARLGENRFDGLDIELRSILKEKGLREQDPFDTVVARAGFLDFSNKSTFEDIVEKASAYLAHTLSCDKTFLNESFLKGTQIGATPVSQGAALPHIRLPGIEHSHMLLARAKKAVKINIENAIWEEQKADKQIYAFFFLVSPVDKPGQHLRILAQIANQVDDETFLNRWLSAKNEQEIKEVLLREERYISLQLVRGNPTEAFIGRRIRDLNLPESTLIALIHRNGKIIVPGGKTILKESDRITVIGSSKAIHLLTEHILA